VTVYLLPEEPMFPPVDEAEPDGLIAIGGDFSVERLVQAYAQGIFPWFMDENDIFWYSPDPRMILKPEQFRKSKSLERIINSGRFEIRIDTKFHEVITACGSTDRPEQDGSWINRSFIDGYTTLHDQGFAHSFETYFNNKLVGGLYGVSLGAAFFGESMFYQMNDASKVAFAGLTEFCEKHNFLFIDCQVESSHLQKLGAIPIERKSYLNLLSEALRSPTIKGQWK
jgi:leucyl/phenylalanyl-tRNA--protein transferase